MEKGFRFYRLSFGEMEGIKHKITTFAQASSGSLHVFDHLKPGNGTVAEWLGRGLQNLVQQFESARYLRSEGMNLRSFYFDHHGSLLKMAGIAGISPAGMVLLPALDLSCGYRQAFQWIFHRA